MSGFESWAKFMGLIPMKTRDIEVCLTLLESSWGLDQAVEVSGRDMSAH